VARAAKVTETIDTTEMGVVDAAGTTIMVTTVVAKIKSCASCAALGS
jgi:hypothetical protein